MAAVAKSAFGRPLDVTGNDWEGLADFVRIAREDLGEGHVVASDTLRYDELKPEDGVVLVHPERSLDVESLSAFMRQGGRVVVLDDFGTADALLHHFGLERVPMPEHPAEFLRQNPRFALAEPAGAHPVVRDLNRVATNHATGLRHPDLSPVLKVRTVSGEEVLVAAAGAVGQGRLLVFGDSSLVMNSMLNFVGNRSLARSVARYAVEGDARGKRGGRLFIVSGPFDQQGAFGEEGGEAAKLRNLVRSLEDVLLLGQKEGLPPWAAYLCAVVAGLAVVVWVGSRAGKTHKPVAPRFTRGVPLVAQGGAAGHAAVLAAPKTSRALAMLELKAALEEELGLLAGAAASPGGPEPRGADALLARVAAAGLLDAEGQAKLRRLLLRMAEVETLMLSRRGANLPFGLGRVKEKDVVEAAVTVKGILSSARSAAHGPAPSSTPWRSR